MEMDSLLRPAQPLQKVSAGADPKSVLCLFFKQGQCKKGDKCKFSHDLTLEGKSEKRSMYVDKRDLEEGRVDVISIDLVFFTICELKLSFLGLTKVIKCANSLIDWFMVFSHYIIILSYCCVLRQTVCGSLIIHCR